MMTRERLAAIRMLAQYGPQVPSSTVLDLLDYVRQLEARAEAQKRYDDKVAEGAGL